MAYELSFYLLFELMSFYWFLYYEIINWELNHWNFEYYKWELNHWNSECCTWELRCWNWKSQLKYCNWNVLTFWLKRDIIFSFEKKSYWKYKNNKKKNADSIHSTTTIHLISFDFPFALLIIYIALFCTLYFAFALFFQLFFSFHFIEFFDFLFSFCLNFLFLYILFWFELRKLSLLSTAMHFTM